MLTGLSLPLLGMCACVCVRSCEIMRVAPAEGRSILEHVSIVTAAFVCTQALEKLSVVSAAVVIERFYCR